MITGDCDNKDVIRLVFWEKVQFCEELSFVWRFSKKSYLFSFFNEQDIEDYEEWCDDSLTARILSLGFVFYSAADSILGRAVLVEWIGW